MGGGKRHRQSRLQVIIAKLKYSNTKAEVKVMDAMLITIWPGTYKLGCQCFFNYKKKKKKKELVYRHP
jgi:hypothetical protein